MTVETFKPADLVSVTPAAEAHFADVVSRQGAQAVRISLKESGCTGFKYVIDEVNELEEGDLSIELPSGLTLYLDSQHVSALRGMVIDYVQEGLNKSLVMNNPNVKDMCGCGESFNVEPQS